MSEAAVLLVGLCTVDVVQRVADLPSPGAKGRSTSVEVVAGGPATNAAVTVAALGGRADLVTVLGSHPLAALARDDLRQHGVVISDVLRALLPFVDVCACSASFRLGDISAEATEQAVHDLGRVEDAIDLPGLVDQANQVAAARVQQVGARAWL